ncbi:MAG: hypothetical protein M3071_07500 [Actinomycetota bacterium]|nr:hypothetical protein [Actinomycetota bacterium]
MLGTVSAGCALSAAVLLVPIVSAAQADLINLGACNSNALGHPFSSWGDSSSYELVPGGDFEGSTSPWTLSSWRAGRPRK